MTEDRIAPKGKIWVCCACGKTAIDRHQSKKFPSWDVSCVLNSILVDTEKCVYYGNGLVKEIKE